MAWFSKDNKEVDATGKTPEQLAAEGARQEKTPAELIAESLSGFEQRITNKFDELGTRVQAVEESTKRPERAVELRETPSVFDNEEAAFAVRIGPVQLRQMELEARMVLSEIKAEYLGAGFGDMWASLEPEIKKVLDGSPVVGGDGKAVRGNPDYIRNVVDMVFGRAARSKGVRFKGTDQTFFLEGAGGDAGGAATTPADGFTDKQRRFLQRAGIDPKDAVKAKGQLEFIN